MNIEVSRINAGIKDSPEKYIEHANADYVYRLKKIVENIVEQRDEKPIILLSGPSGSGKTTTAMMIEKMLDDLGHVSHTLSMDNYFCPLTTEEKTKAALGQVDLESPLRVDSKLLSSQIESMSAGEEVELPKYNFKNSTRETGKRFLRHKGELVIFEGIHALNPDVITVPDSQIWKIYVSVRTRITNGDAMLHPSRVRLLRRMIRDKKFRKRSLQETMNMFHSVETGENKYIMPYKGRSDFDVDTFMPYELSIYRDPLIDQLREMADIPEIAESLAILENIEPVSSKLLPSDSLVCEFVGNSQFKY